MTHTPRTILVFRFAALGDFSLACPALRMVCDGEPRTGGRTDVSIAEC
jgi:hypothetical protein